MHNHKQELDLGTSSSWPAHEPASCTIHSLVRSHVDHVMEHINAARSSGDMKRISREGEAQRSCNLQLVVAQGRVARRSATERAIEAMLKQGLVKKLVELQRSGLGGDLIEIKKFDENDEKLERNREGKQKRHLEMHPFASCVARFAVQLEVGERLRQREKMAFKLDILVRVREASISDAEATTIVAKFLTPKPVKS